MQPRLFNIISIIQHLAASESFSDAVSDGMKRMSSERVMDGGGRYRCD